MKNAKILKSENSNYLTFYTILPCCRPVQQVGSLVYGPPSIIPNRVQMELAFLNATLIDLNPAGITNRWINYTAHQSQTPGACPESRFRAAMPASFIRIRTVHEVAVGMTC